MSLNLRGKMIPLAILSLLALVMLMFAFNTSVVNASSDTTKNENGKKVETFTPDNPEQFIKEQGWEKPTPDAKLVEVTRVTEEPNDEIDGIKKENNLQVIYSIKNVKNIGQLCGTTVQARTSGTGGANGVLKLEQTASVSNSYNANVGVSASTVSAGVGFDVTAGMNRTTSYSVNTGGKNYQIVAYDDFQGKSFDVYNIFNKKVGSGTALRQVGFCYAAYEI